MRSKVVGLRVAGIVFGLLALAQSYAVADSARRTGERTPPAVVAHALAAVFSAALCVWLLTLSGGHTCAGSIITVRNCSVRGPRYPLRFEINCSAIASVHTVAEFRTDRATRSASPSG